MSKVGIIAGGGKLPILIGENLIKSGKSIVFTIFKKRKRSAKSIYKLIDDLEKKYIY